MLLWISFVVINFFSISVLWGIFWKERRSCYHSENLVRTRHTCPALLLTQKQRGHRKDRPRLSPPHLMDGTSEWVLFNPARKLSDRTPASGGVSSPWTDTLLGHLPHVCSLLSAPQPRVLQSPQMHLSLPTSHHPASLGMSPPPGPARPLGPAEGPLPVEPLLGWPHPPPTLAGSWHWAPRGHPAPLRPQQGHKGIPSCSQLELHLVDQIALQQEQKLWPKPGGLCSVTKRTLLFKEPLHPPTSHHVYSKKWKSKKLTTFPLQRMSPESWLKL